MTARGAARFGACWPTRLAGLALLATACEASGDPTVRFELGASESWTTRTPLPPAPIGDLALLTNNLDDTVSLVDLGLSPPAEIARLPVGFNPVEREGPHHLALAPDGKTMWVGISNYVPGSGSGPHGSHGTGTDDGHAIQMRVADGAMLASVRVDRNPGDIRMTPDGRYVVMTHFDLLKITQAEPGADPATLDSRLAIIDAASAERVALLPICPAAHGIAVSPDSTRIYAACYDDRVALVDLAGKADPAALGPEDVTHVDAVPIPGTIANPTCEPYALTITPSGDTVWVSCLASGEARALDTRTGAMDSARVVNLGGGAVFGTVSDDGVTLVLPSQGRDRVTWVTEATGAVTGVLDVDASQCVRPHALKFVADGRTLLLACEGDHVAPGSLLVLDAATHAVTAVVPVGRYPDDLVVLPLPRAVTP